MNRLFFLVLFNIPFFPMAFGQRILNPEYDKMLKQLLSHKAPEISVSDASVLTGAIFLDTREYSEYKVSHIKNALWVGYNSFQISNVDKLNLDQQIVVYCSVGYRSEKISLKLIDYGFKNAQNLYGGIFEWVNQEHPVYDMENKKTENVHAYSKKWGKWLSKGNKVYDN